MFTKKRCERQRKDPSKVRSTEEKGDTDKSVSRGSAPQLDSSSVARRSGYLCTSDVASVGTSHEGPSTPLQRSLVGSGGDMRQGKCNNQHKSSTGVFYSRERSRRAARRDGWRGGSQRASRFMSAVGDTRSRRTRRASEGHRAAQDVVVSEICATGVIFAPYVRRLFRWLEGVRRCGRPCPGRGAPRPVAPYSNRMSTGLTCVPGTSRSLPWAVLDGSGVYEVLAA